MEKRITDLVKKDYPRFEVTRFNSASVAKGPVVLIGTFTAINSGGAAAGPRDAYRICLALADLNTKKIISKGFARATTDGINPTPVSFFSDSPVFSKDAATDGYIRSCQGTKAGDPLQPAYVERIASAAILNDAIDAYNGRKYKQALELYESAAKAEGGEQLRVLNGIYLSNWRLGRYAAAEDAFGKVVDYGLKSADQSKPIAVKFLFRKNASRFDRYDREYAMWLKQVAQRTAKAGGCLEIVGHTESHRPCRAERPAVAPACGARARPAAGAGQRSASAADHDGRRLAADGRRHRQGRRKRRRRPQGRVQDHRLLRRGFIVSRQPSSRRSSPGSIALADEYRGRA